MKRLVSMLLLLALMAGVFGLAMTNTAEAVSVRNRKVVSVVYDDSGSMGGEKEEYTSYAMQCFAAMLNKEDRLDITYMSNYLFGSMHVDTGKRAESVKKIREHQGGGGTPVEAVDTAFKTLQKVNDTNENTQYWLIVMTDGQMDGVESRINKIAETKMPNGTKPHVVYMTLCDLTDSFTPKFNKSNIESRDPKSADEIIQVISEVACNIAGRYPVDPGDIKVINDTTFEITSDLPLVNIGILSQRSKAEVVSVADRENNALVNEGNVPVAAPNFSGVLTEDEKNELNGNVALFSATKGNIPAGVYTITFSEPVSKDDLVVMFEPAFELRLELSVDGVVITDPNQLIEGASVDVEAFLYEVGTDTRIAMSMLPSGYKTRISHSEGGKLISENGSLKLGSVQVKPVETELSATLNVPGFFTVSDLIRFTPQAIVLSDMKAQLHYDGSERMVDENGNPDPENVVYVDRLDTNETGIAFQLEIDGAPISRDKALSIQHLFEERVSTDFPEFDVTVTNEGKMIVTPREVWWQIIVGDWIFSKLHNGEKNISCTYDGITASGTLEFKLADEKAALVQFGVRLVILMGIIYLILWIFAKHHFRKPGRVRLYRAYGSGQPYALVAGSTKRIHWLASSDLFNFLGLGGMRIRIRNTPFRVRSTAGDGYRVEGVKNKIVSTGIQYPGAGTPRCQDRYKDFNRVVYISDGNQTYYKIYID